MVVTGLLEMVTNVQKIATTHFEKILLHDFNEMFGLQLTPHWGFSQHDPYDDLKVAFLWKSRLAIIFPEVTMGAY